MANLPVTWGISWIPTFAFQSPMMKRTSFLVLVLEGMVGFHGTIQLQLLQHYWWVHRLGLLWYWMVCLGNEQRSLCHFWDFTQVLISDSFVDYEGYYISSQGFLSTVDIIVIWIKFALAISCLTISNLPGFMDLTFQVPMQYCSLQHQILLSPPDTSIAKCLFCFCPATSFFLSC